MVEVDCESTKKKKKRSQSMLFALVDKLRYCVPWISKRPWTNTMLQHKLSKRISYLVYIFPYYCAFPFIKSALSLLDNHYYYVPESEGCYKHVNHVFFFSFTATPHGWFDHVTNKCNCLLPISLLTAQQFYFHAEKVMADKMLTLSIAYK